MKAKVINGQSDYYLSVIDIKSINFKYVIGQKSGNTEKIQIPYEDVEFIYDHEWEKSIIKYRDILKISLPNTVSPGLYAMLSYSLEKHFKGDINSISVLSDVNERAKRGYWYKHAVLIVNEIYPIAVTASGRNYTMQYSINIEDIETYSFIYNFQDDINKLKETIDACIKKLNYFEMILHNFQNAKSNKNKCRRILRGYSKGKAKGVSA